MKQKTIEEILSEHVEEFSVADSKIKGSPDYNMVQAMKELEAQCKQPKEVRAFRIKHRWVTRIWSSGKEEPYNKVTNQRDYVGLDKLLKFGLETFDTYTGRHYDGTHVAELYESINGKWVKLSDAEIAILRRLK